MNQCQTNGSPLPWTEVLNDSELVLTFEASLYSIESIQRASYWFTDRCYVHLDHTRDSPVVRARLVAKDASQDQRALAGEFGNRVLDEELRLRIASETKPVRELIVAQAFAEADLPSVRNL